MERSEADIASVLVERILRDDKLAEKEMVERYSRGLLFILRRQCDGDHQLAQDLVQETWGIVITKIRANELRDPQKLSAFIIKIGKYQVFMHFRKSANSKTISSGDANDIQSILTDSDRPSDANTSPERELTTHNLCLMVRRTILELNTHRDRDVITRYYLNEQEKKVICSDLNIKTSTFDNVLYRAKKRFKQLWLEVDDGS